MPQRYTYCYDVNKDSGLLFESTNTDEIGAIKELQEIFPKGYSVRLVSRKKESMWNAYENTKNINAPIKAEDAKATLVSESPFAKEPDQARMGDKPTEFYFEGKKYIVSLRQRYDDCLSLFKAVGCRSCPDRGLKCLGEGAGFTPPDRFYDPKDDEVTLELLEKQYAKLGGFEFVSPSATRVKNEFASKFRHYWEHSFEMIDQNAEELSERAEKAAESRAFKRNQCSKCVISNSCEAFRHCKGPYPDLQQIIEQSCAEFYTALDKSAWPQWQLWEIGRNMGLTAKHSRWHVMLAGLTLQGNQGIVPKVTRAKLDISDYKLATYEEIAKVFDLAKTEEDSVPPVTDPELIATLWLALNSHNAHKKYGWGSYRHVCGIGINAAHVSIQWTNGKYLHGVDEIEKVADIAKRLTYGRLGDIEKLAVR